MTTEKPEYQGLEPILLPADGRTLSRYDWPRCYEKIGGAVWEDGVRFSLPIRGPETMRDPASFANIKRECFVNVRLGTYFTQATKIDELDELLRIR